MRGLRRVRRLSQEALAVLAGLRHAHASSVERSSRKTSLGNIHALGDALEMTAADLLTLARGSLPGRPWRRRLERTNGDG